MSTSNAEEIIEAGYATPIYVDGLVPITVIGTVAHLVFTTRQSRSEVTTRIDRIVQTRLIVPLDKLQAIGRAMLSGPSEAVTSFAADITPQGALQ